MKSGLFAFIFLSAFVHAIIIGVKSDFIFNINDSHEQGSSIIKIELSNKKDTPQTSSEAQVQTVSNAKPATPASTVSEQKFIPHKKLVTTDKPIVLVKIKSPDISSTKHFKQPQTTTSKSSQKKEIKNNINNHNENIKALLNNELSKHFYYPKAAQRKNRQGRVLLAFTISALGHIENIHVNKSSGFSILDNAAINALKKIDANKDLARELNGDSSEHRLPVTFTLTH